ncbi:Thioredoxin-1 [Posidoniimonas polymericola]|uniref:Thioredoxin-1 n=1 Tax=Posidoniimonas polymericola TaxID=2528002 RepID=A0A5C5YHZ0_9BACT|nr:trypsin-like peptidase domain-containing protein [Posidoniimonas polymericola]TWT73742.1 Thioredoxin-1 [Posidoniimonas polymericola]
MVFATPRAAILVLALLLLPAQQSSAQATLLDFSLPTCGPCRQMDPVVSRLESEGFRVKRIDGSRSPQVAQQFRVDRYPTFVVLAGDREVKRVVGLTSYESLRQMLTSAAPQQAAAAAPRGGPATFRTVPGSSQTNATLQAAGGAPPIDIPGRAPKTLAPAPSADVDAMLNATVRMTVEDASGQSYGTGTIVDAREGEALVLTCAHLFRGPEGQPINDPSAVTVELYQAQAGQPRVVQRVALSAILSCNFESDVALVAFKASGQVAPARIAADANLLRQGDPVLSSGCDHGADPSVRTGVVTAVNRYQGPANITASGAPVVGRSGGGLFSAKGEVVGVCNAADNEDDEGIYAALAEVHAELDKLQLSAIYRGGPLQSLADERPAPPTRPAPAIQASVAQASVAQAPGAQAPGATFDRQPMAPLGQPAVRSQGPDSTDTLAALSPRERAAMQEIVQQAGNSEVVCVIRSKDGKSRSKVLTIEDVSPEFVRALLAAYHSQPDAAPAAF